MKYKTQNTKYKTGFTPLKAGRPKAAACPVAPRDGTGVAVSSVFDSEGRASGSDSNEQGRLLTGFTLMEVILAMGIFSIGILAAISLFPKGIKLGRESKEMSVATNLAQEKIEEVLSQNYDDIATGTIEPKARINNNPSSQFYIYQRQTVVNFADANLNTTYSDTGLKKITTTVYYPEGSQEKTVEITRLLNKR